ncbi:MAG: RdgB/HAM1 family non-canonical purine NTP pyrophosphatase [Candidatus Berkiella sp.]
MKVVIASENHGKLLEIQAFFKSLPLEVVAQSEFAVPSIEETGLSFVENAILKARHAAQYSQLPALADDSGLVVDALGGRPGIYSARYAGKQASMPDNIQKLLAETQSLNDSERRAHFYCAIAFVRHAQDPVPIICQAQWDGQILKELRGTQGFGYDPIFYIPSLGCTAAELPLAKKNQISHRAQALSLFVSAFSQAFLVA